MMDSPHLSLTGLSATKEESPSLGVPGNQPGPFHSEARLSAQVGMEAAFSQTLP